MKASNSQDDCPSAIASTILAVGLSWYWKSFNLASSRPRSQRLFLYPRKHSVLHGFLQTAKFCCTCAIQCHARKRLNAAVAAHAGFHYRNNPRSPRERRVKTMKASIFVDRLRESAHRLFSPLFTLPKRCSIDMADIMYIPQDVTRSTVNQTPPS